MNRPAGRATDPGFWQDRFETAQRSAGGVVERRLAIGPCQVRLRFAGPALLPTLMPALEPRMVPPTTKPPHFTIHLWDTASTGVAVRPQADAPMGRRALEDERGQVTARHEPETDVVRAWWPAGDLAWWQAPDAARLHYYCRGSPLREPLHAALRRAGMALLHAGAVGFPHGGVLLVGPGGSGKSTTALACLDSELGFVGEDYTAVTLGRPPAACGIYSSAKLNDDTLGWLPRLGAHVTNPVRGDAEKNLVHLHQARPDRLLAAFPLQAVFIIGRRSDASTDISPATRGDALRALAPSTLFQLRSAGGEEFAQLAGLLRDLPCYRLRTGSDLAGIPRAIIRFLKDT